MKWIKAFDVYLGPMEGIPFTLIYKGIERTFEAMAQKYGYTYRIQVKVDEIPIYFEPDEEGQLRAVPESYESQEIGSVDPALLEAIANELQQALI